MVKQVQKAKTPEAKTPAKGGKVVQKSVKWNFPFTRKNFIILGIGLGTILLGYILMATGITEDPAVANSKWDNPLAVSVAPVVLVIGYCVIIPYAIIKFFGNKSEEEK